MRGGRHLLTLIVCGAALSLPACAPRRPDLPTGAASPFPDAAMAYEAAVRTCRTAHTVAATLDLSGRAGGQGVRGQVDAGFEAPDKVRLEMRAPIGRPVFILAAAGPRATLYLPREHRVLRDVPTADIVEALVGLPLDAADLRAVVSGCGFGVADPGDGRAYAGGWVAVATGDSTTYLREVDGRWRVAAAARPPLLVHYVAMTATRPSTLRLQAPEPSRTDVTVRISDVNVNVPLAAEAFEVVVPPAADPLTLEELRRAGPLGAP
jgi:hypothetical protein